MATTKVTLGGDRLGSGKKNKISLRNYERSTHDLSYIWRSTMAPGTLVPFMKTLALPGDNFEINLYADVKTLPTLGPLFGSFKLQLDVFQAPIRLYNAQLHNNKLGIGNDMSKVIFPQIKLYTQKLDVNSDVPVEIQQLNQSSLLAYLGIRGNGYYTGTNQIRYYNAMPFLIYWDIYKNYYANKQEEIGNYIAPDTNSNIDFITRNGDIITFPTQQQLEAGDTYKIYCMKSVDIIDLSITLEGNTFNVLDVFDTAYIQPVNQIILSNPMHEYTGRSMDGITENQISASKNIRIKSFPLENIDEMREYILKAPNSSPFIIDSGAPFPYSDALNQIDTETRQSFSSWAMNNLGLKTYNSDIFNNWLSTEWIDGEGGINEITAVDTTSGSFSMDTLNLAKKVYDMLNRIAVSGGSYEDWLQAVYSHEPYRRAETPMYMGGMSREIVFQEVVSTASAESEPLATLAGRGRLSGDQRGGNLSIRVDEPSYLMAIVSITPRIDYSQGNDWDVMLRTMNDLHKPALDAIGFQELITWKMAAWELQGDSSNQIEFSAGKQPAWLDYMTNFNKTYGNFANPDDQMFMTLNRRYEMNNNYRIKDLTTYIDPQKFNYIFADTQRDAQNFWVQIAIDMTARRKMSAKIMPNL